MPKSQEMASLTCIMPKRVRVVLNGTAEACYTLKIKRTLYQTLFLAFMNGWNSFLTGFASSFAQIDDEDDLGPATALNRSGGALPDGIWGYNISSDTRYFFCCRSDGPSTSTPIVLPFKKPFYLFKAPKEDKCQEVKGFTARHEVLRLDAEDSRQLGKPSVIIKGSVPMTRSRVRGADIDVHYCYYHNQTSKGEEKWRVCCTTF